MLWAMRQKRLNKMKKQTLYLIITILLVSCNAKTEDKNNVNITEPKTQEKPKDEIKKIEQNGKSFYEWYFKNDFPNCGVIKDKNEKCLIDTIGYFKSLRKLGTISEKFINKEKQRLLSCSEFISTIDYSDYENAEAYDYDQYCGDFYYMYWIKSQEPPSSFSVKNVKKINNNLATLDIYENYGKKDEPLSKIFLEKEGTIWKIIEIKFIVREESKAEKILIYRKWRNTMVTLHISNGGLAFEYHGQCMYFYPIKKINENEFEMIWSNDMDCSFDNGTRNTFNLKNFPTIGKPFAKFKLKNDILYAEYYYKDWVKKYTEQVAENVFTSKYFIKNEEN